MSIKHLYHQQQAGAEKHQDADGWLKQVEASQKLANHHKKLRQGKGSLVGWSDIAGSSEPRQQLDGFQRPRNIRTHQTFQMKMASSLQCFQGSNKRMLPLQDTLLKLPRHQHGRCPSYEVIVDFLDLCQGDIHLSRVQHELTPPRYVGTPIPGGHLATSGNRIHLASMANMMVRRHRITGPIMVTSKISNSNEHRLFWLIFTSSSPSHQMLPPYFGEWTNQRHKSIQK